MIDLIADGAHPAEELDKTVATIVSLKDAARALGISESGVRKRLARGQLDGQKDEKGYWVSVTLPADVTLPAEDSPEDVSAREARELDLYRQMVADKDKLIREKDEEINFLRQQLSTRDALYGESLRQMRALLPPEPKKKPRGGWWPWGRKDEDGG